MPKTKNVLGICGSPKTSAPSASEHLCRAALAGAEEVGATTRLVRLVDYPIVDCDGCGDCMNSKQCHLFKDPDDRYTRLYKQVKWADAFIFASPVYALGLPFTWKQWLDRCEPADEDDLNFSYYNYEVAADVKGKAFQGKVAGQIVTSGGIGQEWAMASLMPLWTNVKLSVVASVGLSLIEFDEQPGIRDKPWGQGVQNAEFAVEISRQVGRRVTAAIGFSTFNLTGASPRIGRTAGRDCLAELRTLVDLDDKPFVDLDERSGETSDERPLVLVVAGQAKGEDASHRIEALLKRMPGLDVKLVCAIDPLPHFITPDFVRARIGEQNQQVPVLLDWDRGFCEQMNLAANVDPHTLVFNARGEFVRAVSGTNTTREILTEVEAITADLNASLSS